MGKMSQAYYTAMMRLTPTTIFFLFNITIAILVGSLLLLDSFGGNDTAKQLIGFSSVSLAIFHLFVLIFFPKKSEIVHSNLIKKIIFILGGMLIALAAGLSIWTYLTPDNYVYTLTRLNPIELLTLGHYIILLVFLLSTLNSFQQYGKKIIQFFPLWLVFLTLIMYLQPFDRFDTFASEDGFAEYLQVGILLLTSKVILTELLYNKKIVKIKRLVFIGVMVGLVFLTMEEISWGQRLFNWRTPEYLSTVNVQNETTIHNIGILNQLQLVGYLVITALGTFLTFKPLNKEKPWFWNPPRACKVTFLIPFIFYLSFVVFETPYHLWAEVIEVLFYFGLFCWLSVGTAKK